MDAEALARAFEPYFSTKAAGTGLGLPIAKRNVELSGGSISMTSERDKGTTVESRSPLCSVRLQPDLFFLFLAALTTMEPRQRVTDEA